MLFFFFFFSSRRRHTRFSRDWSSDVCSSDLERGELGGQRADDTLLRVEIRLAAGQLIRRRLLGGDQLVDQRAGIEAARESCEGDAAHRISIASAAYWSS